MPPRLSSPTPDNELHSLTNNDNNNNNADASPYFNNASQRAPVTVDCDANLSERNEQIARAVSIICPQFFPIASRTTTSSNDGKSNDVSIKPLGGGLSNHLFIVSPSSSSSPSSPQQQQQQPQRRQVLVRVHVNAENDQFVDREEENRTLAWLSALHKAPQFYGRFENGRIEEFYPDCRTICHSDIMSRRLSPLIATAMADLHMLDYYKRETTTGDDDGCCCSLFAEGGEGRVWGRIDGWFELAKRVRFAGDDDKMKKWESLGVETSAIEEWKQLKKELMAVDDAAMEAERLVGSHVGSMAIKFSREVVFAHMDCQSLNMLQSDRWGDDEIRLIDFEYAGLNPRSMDLANTFCECCDMNNLCADYEKEYPSSEEQNRFLRCYVRAVKEELADWLDGTEGWDVFLDVLRRDIKKYAMVSHLGWAVWAVGQALVSTIDFDYLEYAKHRMDGYWVFKKSIK